MQENCTKTVHIFFILPLQHLSSQFPLTTMSFTTGQVSYIFLHSYLLYP